MRILWLVLIGLFTFAWSPRTAEAACDSGTVQAQITAASSGATVTLLPASCTATWSSGSVSIPSSKIIILDGNSATITINITITINQSDYDLNPSAYVREEEKAVVLEKVVLKEKKAKEVS